MLIAQPAFLGEDLCRRRIEPKAASGFHSVAILYLRRSIERVVSADVEWRFAKTGIIADVRGAYPRFPQLSKLECPGSSPQVSGHLPVGKIELRLPKPSPKRASTGGLPSLAASDHGATSSPWNTEWQIKAKQPEGMEDPVGPWSTIETEVIAQLP